MPTSPCIRPLKFETDAGPGERARIGLIILQSDQTIEPEFASLLHGSGVALYHARIPNAMEVTPDTLRRMERELPGTVRLLPGEFRFDAIGYCCTSGATEIGEEKVDRIIRRIHPDARTSNPLSACKAALCALGLKRIALITPYLPSVTTDLRQRLEAAGFEVSAVASFCQSNDLTVARIAPHSILEAIEDIGAGEDCDGVFVACTGLRALEIIPEAEVRVQKPILSSNQALAWHLMRLIGINDNLERGGRLFRAKLAVGT